MSRLAAFLLALFILALVQPALLAVALALAPVAVAAGSVVIITAAAVACARLAAWGCQDRGERPEIRDPGASLSLIPDHAPPTAPDAAWEQSLLVFAFLGGQYGSFSWRTLEGHVTRAGWDKLTGALVSAGVIEKRRAGGYWRAGWSYSRLRAEVKYGRVAISAPAGEVPRVTWERSVPTAARGVSSVLHTQHVRAGSVVIDGTAARERAG